MADKPFTAFREFDEAIKQARRKAIARVRKEMKRLPGKMIRIGWDDPGKNKWSWSGKVKTASLKYDGDDSPYIKITRSDGGPLYLSWGLRIVIVEE